MTTCARPACQRAMWSSKMAARWRGEDGSENAGNSGFRASNSPYEGFLPSKRHLEGMEVNTQSCMDQAILAIFEDSAVASEDNSSTEEESETLLSALTEMLDSVEDDDRTMSPFDTLPDTKLLTYPEPRDNSGDLSLVDRLRPRSRAPNETFTIKINGENKELEHQQQILFHSKKGEAEVEVFSTTSLVNLVKLMHSYCLKLHVEEEGDKVRRNHTYFSREEVWKYERPSEESDEEINVVSDDEVTVKEKKERDEKSDNGNLLKSALLCGNLSRGKKRVSFGPVQVASFDESLETGLKKENLTSRNPVLVPLNSTKALENPAGPAQKPQTCPSEMDRNKGGVPPPKGRAKAKALSLQQYRQLCQKRQPLVEKQGNYTTKWPSVSEPPQELTPILCLPEPNSCGPKPSHHCVDGQRSGAEKLHLTSAPTRPQPSEAKPSPPLRLSGLKRRRTESKTISPASPLPGIAVDPNVTGPESKRSPVKKAALLSSDPPNPVLLPLPVNRTTPSTDHSSSQPNFVYPNKKANLNITRQVQNKSAGMSLQQQPSSFAAKPEVLSETQDCTALLQEIKTRFTKIASGAPSSHPALIEPPSDCKELLPPKFNPAPVKESKPEPKTPLSPSQADSPVPVKEPLAEVPHSKSSAEEPLPTATAVSGIEATDLTSLLEQFEETQAKEERVEHPVELVKPLCTSDSPGTPQTVGNLPHLQVSEGADVPEPLGDELILSSRQDLPARRKNPPSKAIQIIDPRPLPPKKPHSNLSEVSAVLSSPNIYLSISADHDYCRPSDCALTNVPQHSRASKLKDLSNSTELQVTHDSGAAAEIKQNSTCEVSTAVITTVNTSATSVMQLLPEEPRTGSEISPPSDKVLSLLDSAAAERAYDCAVEDKTGPCSLPTPPPSPPVRGRDRTRYRRRSPRSDSSSSTCSSSSSSSCSSFCSRKRCFHKRSESSSCSSSPSRSPPRRYTWSHSRVRRSRSRSRSCSHSRSPPRSRSPAQWNCHRPWRDVYSSSSRESRRRRREHEIRIQNLKAIDERRVVYVGRICRSMTHNELRERFSQFGEVEFVSLHFRERGDHYGFVTFYNTNDAFAAIDNGSKLRRPNELPFDLCFGGRRQFCNSDYADLECIKDNRPLENFAKSIFDANRDADPSPAKSKFEDLDFDQLLKQAQRGLKR